MTVPRLIPRREVLAFIALTGKEDVAPDGVEMRDYEHDGVEWHTITLQVASAAAVRFWMDQFGHQPHDLHIWPSSRGDALYRSQGEVGSWRGFTTAVIATVSDPAPGDLDDLDDATREQLAALAEPDAQDPT